MRLRPIPYMRWSKALGRERGIRNLAKSGIFALLTEEDLELGDTKLTLAEDNADGLPALKEAIAGRYGVRSDQVLTAEGTSLANFLILAAWVRPGDPVLLEDPYYEPLGAVLEGIGARIRTVPVDAPAGHGALLDLLRGTRAERWRAVVVTHPHNPTGAGIGERLFSDLAVACEDQGALLIVDEAYRELLFEDPPGCAARIGPSVVSTSSLTKPFGLSTLRAGWAIGPRPVIDRAIEIHDNLGVYHPPIAEAMAARVMADGPRLESWRRRIRSRVEANRAALAAFLARQRGFECRMPESGILAFARWKGRQGIGDADTLCARARKEARVAITPGRFFGRPDHVRFGIGASEKEVRAALDALGAFLNASTGTAKGDGD